MKTIGYLIFAGFYYVFRLFCKVKKKKIFCIMTHDGSKDSNVGVMVEYLKEKKEGYSFFYLKKSERNRVKNIHNLQGKLVFFIIKPYHLATSEFVMMDNVFLPMAYIKFRRRVRILQLWHGTGTIKKFGQDVNTGRLKKLEKMANSRITHLIVNSEKTKKLYAHVFGIEEEKVFVYGLPRTDLFFDNDKINERKQRFFKQYPMLQGKKLVLYVPTFRDQEYLHPKLALDTEVFCKEMQEEYVLLLRVHPFVAEALEKSQEIKTYDLEKQVISMSSYPDISTLLLVSDFVITDYSSVIFEYCLMRRPIVFYAYDLEQFSDFGRGFYESYEEYVPGPVTRDTKSLVELLKKNHFDIDRMEAFRRESYRYLDGKSAERIYLHIFNL